VRPLDAFWHLFGFFLPALATGALAAGATKWLWRAELRDRSWRRLAGWAIAAGAATLLAGLVVTGRDGRMLSYAAMVAANALALWWVGFAAPRR
jgi:vacuolar-type H+-ATPase subunit I/STV1